MIKFTNRTEILIGNKNQEKLSKSKIIIFGIGGVGGFVAECLARTGIGNITLVDGDKIETTNINRQIIATLDAVGYYKVDIMARRIKSINIKCNIKTINQMYNSKNMDKIDLEHYDYVIDCIDSLIDKELLIKNCYLNKIPIISAMGAGNRYDIPEYKLADIHKTSYDPLAKLIRKFCVTEKIKKLNVVYTTQLAKVCSNNEIGSIAYQPMAMASIIAGKVVKDIIKD